MVFIPEEEQEAWEKHNAERVKQALWGSKPHTPTYEDTLKWAWVVVNGKREMVWVSNEDNRAFKSTMYDIVRPLEEVKYDYFERWCTPFDV